MTGFVFQDARGRGFSRRVSLRDAQAGIDAACPPLSPRPVPLAGAVGLCLAAPVIAPGDWPPADRAARDGVAIDAADSLGAGSYTPIPLIGARELSSGDPLPPGTNAVLPVEALLRSSGGVEAVEAVPPGAGVERRAAALSAGASALPVGRVLRPSDLGLLAGLGLRLVTAHPPPRVRILLVGGPRGGEGEALGLMLAALVRRDGGVPDVLGPVSTDADGRVAADALRAACDDGGADLVLTAGRTGVGVDDVAPLALAAAGRVAWHGVALRPGDSAGLGAVGAVPVLLLPGEPMACWSAYALLGARAVRRRAGLGVTDFVGAGLGRAVTAVTARKLVSEIGSVDLHRVRFIGDGRGDGRGGDRVEPVASPVVPGLAALARADGVVVCPADSEGVPAGATVQVHILV